MLQIDHGGRPVHAQVHRDNEPLQIQHTLGGLSRPPELLQRCPAGHLSVIVLVMLGAHEGWQPEAVEEVACGLLSCLPSTNLSLLQHIGLNWWRGVHAGGASSVTVRPKVVEASFQHQPQPS